MKTFLFFDYRELFLTNFYSTCLIFLLGAYLKLAVAIAYLENQLFRVAPGGEGDDYLVGYHGDDFIEGGEGDDILLGNQGNDTLDGGSNKDLLSGGFGNDILFGGFGNDTLWGKEASDIFALELDRGSDIINDFTDDLDLIGLTEGIAFEDLTITGSDNAQIIDSNDNILMVLSEVNANTITAEDFITL